MGSTPLHRIRKARNVSLEAVAQACGVHNATISRVERGVTPASPKLAEDIVRYFGDGITEVEILYPERFPVKPEGDHAAH